MLAKGLFYLGNSRMIKHTCTSRFYTCIGSNKFSVYKCYYLPGSIDLFIEYTAEKSELNILKNMTVHLDDHQANKLYGLDHLRALAITMVFFYHYQILFAGNPEWLMHTAKFGWTGVDLFFVLSGFLISSQLFSKIKSGKEISLKEFYLKRFFRIIPAYWIVVAIYFCVPGFREREALPSIFKFLTFTQNFGLQIFDFGTFSHAWSLCVEEHFYLLLPLILILLQYTKLFKRSYWLLVVLFIFGVAIRYSIWEYFYLPEQEEWHKLIYYPTYNRIDGLLVGVSIAAIYQFRPLLWNKISKFGNTLIVIGLLILTGAYFICYEEQSYAASVFGFLVVALGYGFLVSGAISPTSFLYQWNSKITTFIAVLSYSIYLTHKGIIHITQQIAVMFNINIYSSLMIPICVISCILGAWILNLTIEKPFMKWRKRLIE